MNPIFRTITASMLVFGAHPAFAAPEIHQEQVRIQVADGAGPDEIYTEIHKQARRACDSRAIYAHRQLANRNECRQHFVADAVAAFDRPQLTALHRARTGVTFEQLADTGRD